MTKTILSILLTLCMLNSSAAKKPVIWEKPIYLSTSINRLQLNSVEFHDTATIVKASIASPDIWILGHIHLYGDDSKNYKLKFIKEFPPQTPIPVDEHGVATMTLVFEPMPLNTQFFDMLEGFAIYENRVMGISEAINPVKIKPYALNEEKVEAFRKDFFRTDTACVKGKIEGYSRSAGYSSLNIYYSNIFTTETAPIVIPINEDGTFEHKFVLHYPILDCLVADNISVYFLIKPGETLCFTINQYGKATVSDPSGKPTEYSAITSNMPRPFSDSKYQALYQMVNKYGFKNYIKIVEDAYENALATHDYLAERFHYNDIEYIMGKINMQEYYAGEVVRYYGNNSQIRKTPKSELQNLPDSLRDILNPENYTFLRKIPFNDPLTMSSNFYIFLLSSTIYGPVFEHGTGDYEKSTDPTFPIQWFKPYDDSIVDSIQMCRDKAIFGREDMSLFLKLKYVREFYNKSRNGKLNYMLVKSWRINDTPADSVDFVVNKELEEAKHRASIIKSAMHNPMFESLIDEYVNYGINAKQMSYSLPDCEATTLLRKITDKYKGKYLYIDFWATYCGPCRAGIESTKPWREELRNNPDFEFIYITGDKDSPQKQYDEYVAENLNEAEVYRVPQDEYNKYMDLFKFSGIPHYEALDRNGNVLKIYNHYYGGKDEFLRNIESLKKLEK